MAHSDGEKDDAATKSNSIGNRFFGTATVGERGQIVVPAEARKRYGIETGDKLLIMGTPSGNALMLFKIDTLREIATKMQEDLQRAEQDFHNHESHNEQMEETDS